MDYNWYFDVTHTRSREKNWKIADATIELSSPASLSIIAIAMGTGMHQGSVEEGAQVGRQEEIELFR